MQILIKGVEDHTPKGLTTGFRLRLACATAEGRSFGLDAAILVTREVLQARIPLPNLVIAELQRSGLEECGRELFVDSRRLDVNIIPGREPDLPVNVELGGTDVLNEKTLQKLVSSL